MNKRDLVIVLTDIFNCIAEQYHEHKELCGLEDPDTTQMKLYITMVDGFLSETQEQLSLLIDMLQKPEEEEE